MDDILKNYLENTAVTKPAIESRLTHPITKLRYPTRLAYVLLKKYVNDFFKTGSEPRFISLAGLRGVGKTTLLWQTANHIYQNQHRDIYFFNVNTLKNLGIDLHIALEEFQKHIIKKRFNELSEPITLLFDEVHDDDNWSKTLKILYDEARTAFILSTGSSALLLNQTADLARRMRIEKIYPFKFIEFITAKTYMENCETKVFPIPGLSSELKEVIFYSETPQDVFKKIKSFENKVNKYYNNIASVKNLQSKELWKEYISYHNIPSFIFFKEKSIITDSILDLFKRVIWEDIPKFKPTFTDNTKIERLLLRLAGSDEINPEKLAGIIGVKQNEINELIDILAKAELLNILLPYGGLDSKIVKNKKAFFMSPSLRRALLTTMYGQSLPDQFRSKLIEDIIVMYLRRILTDGIISFTTGNNEVNPDFVIETREKPILLEIGTSKTTTKQIKQSKVNYRYGLLISNGITSPNLKEDCISIPLSWFLLL
ncbi:MAG: AAA family ATPase [Bacteroidetes bacterium]|nr:AAA family ATPase [Bacteroidota bacterium]MCL2302664.1 AAA family ATPase [Lentimicrobiaceae bacterium]